MSDQSCPDLTIRMSSGNINESMTSSTMNPRRVEALQRDYERLGFQVKLNKKNFVSSKNNYFI